MSTTTSAATKTSDQRRVPAWGGFNLTFLGLEVKRVLRNKRTMIFILIMPSVFFLIFGLPNKNQEIDGTNWLAYFMVSIAVYGAMVGTTAGGAAVAIDRASGWSRQLRLTPLKSGAYMIIKIMTAMVLGLVAVLVVFILGLATGVHLTLSQWLLSGLAAWIGALVFAALGLFMGYLLPAENVMQILGPALAILAMFGGLFIPLQTLPSILQEIAKYTPVYGVGEIARSPLTGSGFTAAAVANVIIWLLIFAIGAARLFRSDTQRV